MEKSRPTFTTFKAKALKKKDIAIYYYVFKPFFIFLKQRLLRK